MKWFTSKRKIYFKVLIGVLFLVIWWLAYLKVDTYLTEQKIAAKQVELDAQNKQLDASKNLALYSKLLAVRQIQETVKTMPRSEHIPKVIDILENIKGVDTDNNETIVLSDFKVSLDEISLKWSVTNLILLYYSSEKRNFVSLLDRFMKLDFTKDIRIQTYDKVAEKNYQFFLKAKVINNATSK